MNIEKRNVAVCVILSFVTCGIYSIIWIVKMLKEAVQVKDANDDGILEIILGIFICPVGFFLAEQKLTEGCQARGIEHRDRSVLYIILGFLGLGIVDFALMQSDLNAIADINASGYQQPDYQQPGYQQPGYQQPVNPEPVNPQPVNPQPDDQQPSEQPNEQPTGEQPTDEQPTDEQPTDEQPTDEQPTDEQ